ncbi:MAG TPA: acyltransferase [Candidatus Limnocylindrales bacterium]|nr:acyltransferase [Candidatus Limnocylindrales bacterium]
MIDPSARVHATADIEPDVQIASGTSVDQRTRIGGGARLGADCSVGRDVFIDAAVVIGDRVQVHHRAMIYEGVGIADSVFIGPGAILTNDRYPRAVASTGDLARAADRPIVPSTLAEGCTIGAGAVVVAGVAIGSWAMVGAGAVVTRDVPNHALVVGSPAHRIGWVCACGARLVDSKGDPMAAEPGRYAAHQELICPSCGRTYAYIADAETLDERSGPRQGAPA